ncbi:hypothetical protein NQZ79_g2382 [Umbelopsis isabellina]|nr:hypothetical protein NQZ79_g2382 [Umbelopsis isabellina]
MSDLENEEKRLFDNDQDEEEEEMGEDTARPSDSDDEEEEEDEDEEEARKIAEGFIVDDEDEEDDESDEQVTTKRKKRKKVHEVNDEDSDSLDEEDLALLEENMGIKLARNEGPKLKRLKRGRQEEKSRGGDTDMKNFFSDEEADEDVEDTYARRDSRDRAREEEYASRNRFRREYDDMNDFIADDAEDDLEDAVQGGRRVSANRLDKSEAVESRGDRRELMDMLPADVDQDALDDMYDIFGDGADYEYAMFSHQEYDQDTYSEQREPQLKDVFEPSELQERMLTEEDEDIRLRDVPERMQMRYQGLNRSFAPATDEQVEAESIWIANVMAAAEGKDRPSDEKLNATKYVVKFFTQEFLEVPYIVYHRRDYFTDIDKQTGRTHEILTTDDLWKIYDLDFKYYSFADRKRTFGQYISKLGIEDEYITEMEKKSDKIEEIADLLDYVNLKYARDVSRSQKYSKGPKRPVNRSLYNMSMDSKVKDFVPHFGITPKEFGANYLDGTRRHYPEDTLTGPEDDASNYVDGTFVDSEKVLKAAKAVIAQEIAFDPQVRKAVRRDWESRSCVSVKPTDKGMRVIDEFHPMHPFKFLLEKPVNKFKDGQFVHILKAESDGLVTIDITLRGFDRWFAKFSELYMSDGYSDSAQAWNNQRSELLKLALDEYLNPLMAKSIREKLRIEAQEHICEGAWKNLQEKVDVKPYRTQYVDEDALPRVMTISWGNGDQKDSVMVAFVNQYGRLADQLRLSNLKDDLNRQEFMNLITHRKPDVIGVAGFNIQTRRLLENVQNIVNELKEQTTTSRSSRHDRVHAQVTVVEDEAARLYQGSKRAMEEFKELPPLMRYCISLARRLQNPVLEYVALGRDLLQIRHHPLQNLVAEDMMLPYLERALVNVVNSIGIDINAALKDTYVASALPYICGFGPRKAQHTLQRIEATGGELESRSALVLRRLTPMAIFMNCASFLRIVDLDGADVLDDTRIHPQDYELARKMAADALEIDEEDMDDFDAKKAVVAKVIRSHSDKLNDLILEDYAVVLREQYDAPKRQILEHIKLELQGPYRDRRQEYKKYTANQVFTMITGETDQTLKEGFIVPVIVTKIRGKWANCRLDSGIDGVMSIDNVSDRRLMSIDEVLSVGQTLDAKVLRIDRERYLAELSCKDSDLINGDVSLRKQPDDEYFSREEEDKIRKQQNSARKKAQKSNRVIKHPLFHQLNHREAEEFLESRQRGDLVIRPSSKGNDHIAITWKVTDGVYQHVDVVELEKENDYTLGNKLQIGDQIFEDLDELIVTYVEAIAKKVDELMAHHKYKAGGLPQLYDFLTSATMANPKMSAYGFCMDEKAGYFDLAFKLNAKASPSRWLVKVLPNGYRLQNTSYPNVADLINGFKRIQLSKNNQKQQQQQQRPPQARPSRGGPPPTMHAPPQMGYPPPHMVPPPMRQQYPAYPGGRWNY